MSRLNAFRRPRLHLFDDTGMPQDLRRSLYWVIWGVTAGMFGTVVTTGAAWSGFQREVLGANDFQLGLLAAIPVGMNVVQLIISHYMEKKRNRRFLFLLFGLLGRFFWIPIGLAPILFSSFSVDLRIWIVIVFVAFVSTGNSFVNLGFGSLMGDLVPMRIRGQFFSVRQRVYLAAGVVCGILVARLIDEYGAVGYTVALVMAGVTSMLDIVCFFFVKWPPMLEPEGGVDQTPFRVMLKEVFANKLFMRVTLFFTLWQFSVGVAAPFWNIYMIEDLQMSFLQMSLYSQIVSNLVTVLTISRWGRLIDRYGNKPIMQLAMPVCCILGPLPWLFVTKDTTWLVLLSNIMTGFMWPIMDLGQQNLYLSESPRKHRSMYVAVFFASINLTGIALGNAVGGYLMQTTFSAWEAQGVSVLSVTLTNSHYVFMLTAALRLIVAFAFIRTISEEGSWSLGDTIRDIVKERSQIRQRRLYQWREYRLRKRARRGQRGQG